jgi:hypothetical protein
MVLYKGFLFVYDYRVLFSMLYYMGASLIVKLYPNDWKMSDAKERLDRLQAKRGGHRGVCTKLAKEAEELAISPENGDITLTKLTYM